jgi:hypothetical protein
LAWTLTHEDDDYYVMHVDGSDRRHVLRPMDSKIPFGVQVSPDATKLAYVRSTYLGPGRERYQLFVLDLASGHTTNLGHISPAGRNYYFDYKFAWNDDSISLLVQSSDRTAIDLIGLGSATRATYLSVSDQRITAPYAEARPGAGPPTEIRPIGRTPNPYFTGLALLASGQNGADPAVVVLSNGPTRAFAVPTDATGVRFTWAVLGTRFLLASWVDAPRPQGLDALSGQRAYRTPGPHRRVCRGFPVRSSVQTGRLSFTHPITVIGCSFASVTVRGPRRAMRGSR